MAPSLASDGRNRWGMFMDGDVSSFSEITPATVRPRGSGEFRVRVRRLFSATSVPFLGALGYYAASKLGFALTPTHHAISAFWPPNSVLLAVLLLVPRSKWWTLLLAVLPAHLLVQFSAGVPALTALGWFCGNAAEALIGALCILHFKKHAPLFTSIKGIIVFLCFGVVFAPLLTSFLDAGVVLGTGWGSSYWILWVTRLFSNALAELTVVPALVVLVLSRTSLLRMWKTSRLLEATLLAIAIVSTSVFAFGAESGWRGNTPALVYSPLPVLLWATIRFGVGGVSASLLATSLIALWNALQGRDPFTVGSVSQNVLTLQILFCSIGPPFMLLAAYVAELKQSSSKLVAAQDQERHRIARELHDDVCQQLTLVQLDLEEARDVADPSLNSRLAIIYDQVSDVAKATHEISHGLYPTFLKHSGLGVALSVLCRRIGTEKSLQVSFIDETQPTSASIEISLCLYRVAQEALQNVAKHSHAQNVTIELKDESDRISLRIVDDGIGFNSREEIINGLGLISMQERVRLIGGTLRIRSSPNSGTTIEALVPPAKTQSGEDSLASD
jgi:signal transduction histidine kinase